MKMIVRKMLLGFFTVCIILTTVAYVTYVNMGKLVDRVNQDDFSLSILKNIETIHINALDIETGMMGYLIAGNDNYLEPFSRGRTDIVRNLDTLIGITRTQNLYTEDAEELKKYCELLIQVSDELVEYERLNKTDSVRRITLLYNSKRYMDGLRSIIINIEKKERTLLRLTASESVKKALITKYGFLTTAMLAILILLVVFFVVRKELIARFRAEKKLQISSNRIFDLYNNAPCGYHSIGFNNLYLDINDVELKWLGYSREEVIGKLTIYDVLIPEDHRKISDFVDSIDQEKVNTLKDMEVTYKRKDGSTFDAMINSTVTFDHKNRSPISRTVVLDITEIKHSQAQIRSLYEELEKYNKQLVLANEELESFSYSVSHDLRAPLRAIDGYCKILLEDHGEVLDNEGKRVLAVIMKNSKQMGILIDDLLDFSRLGRKKMRLVGVNSNTLVEEVITELNIENNISIKIETLVNCIADRGLLKHVWQNLISNSVKYTSKALEASIHIYSYIDKEMIVYCIEDNGVGFDKKYEHKLFQVFQRLHHSDEYEGSGVGLAIVEKIITKHNGKVWAESEPMVSTKFYFSLPA